MAAKKVKKVESSNSVMVLMKYGYEDNFVRLKRITVLKKNSWGNEEDMSTYQALTAVVLKGEKPETVARNLGVQYSSNPAGDKLRLVATHHVGKCLTRVYEYMTKGSYSWKTFLGVQWYNMDSLPYSVDPLTKAMLTLCETKKEYTIVEKVAA
jgi:hypothetical protein